MWSEKSFVALAPGLVPVGVIIYSWETSDSTFLFLIWVPSLPSFEDIWNLWNHVINQFTDKFCSPLFPFFPFHAFLTNNFGTVRDNKKNPLTSNKFLSDVFVFFCHRLFYPLTECVSTFWVLIFEHYTHTSCSLSVHVILDLKIFNLHLPNVFDSDIKFPSKLYLPT